MQRLRGISHISLYLIGFFVLIGNIVYAQQIPHFIRYQGDIEKQIESIEEEKEKGKDKDKDKDKDLYALTFRVYNVETGGVALWKESHLAIPVKKGAFEVLLGSFVPLDLKFNEDYWLSIEIDAKGEIAPRERMTSFGYAYMSEDSYKVGGRYPDDFALFGHSHIGEDVVSPVAEAINADTVDGLHADQIGGMRDHGLLEGLADDDHLQYLNIFRGDERYAGADWDGLTKLKNAQDHIADKTNPHAVSLEQLGHLDNNPEEEAPTATERGEPTGTEIQGWADDIAAWGHTNLVTNLNADMLDGFHATGSSNPLPNTLLALGADGKFPVSVIPPLLSSGLWTDGGDYIYPSNADRSFKITDTGNLLMVHGKVGIGMENPSRLLQVGSNSHSSGQGILVDGVLGLAWGEVGIPTPEIGLVSLWHEKTSPSTGYLGMKFFNGNVPFVVTSDGKVGIGTTAPRNLVQVKSSHPTETIVEVTNDDPNAIVGFAVSREGWAQSGFLQYYGPSQVGGSGSELLQGDSVVIGSATGVTNGIRIIAANNGSHSAPIIFATGLWYAAAAERMRITSSGNVGIGTANPQGKLDVNGAIYQRGGLLHADYVFEPDYKLESIKEHADYMWQEKHLKAVPKAAKTEDGQEIMEIGSRQRGVLEELEKAHIYISQLNERIKKLEEKIK